MKSSTIRAAAIAVALAAVAVAPAAGSHTPPPIVEKIALTSTRDNPTASPLVAAEIYLMDPDGSGARRLTANAAGDAFPVLSPDGRGKIVFDSNRNRADGEPLNTSDLFLMNADGTEETHLVRGSSATWSPDAKHIAFHASASGTGLPIRTDPGSATEDSDIFVVNVDDLVKGIVTPSNVTKSDGAIDDDPDWSPNGQAIAFTSHDRDDNHANPTSAEVYVLDPAGSGPPQQLTDNLEEERAPDWSPDGTQIAFMCRRGGPDFELCVMDADGSNQVQLTNNTVGDLTPSWSRDGRNILFHRPVGGRFQLLTIDVDDRGEMQLTNSSGLNLLASWGVLEVHGRGQAQ